MNGDNDNPFADAADVEELFGLFGGALSMCWDPKPHAQVFESEQAGAYIEHALARLRELPRN